WSLSGGRRIRPLQPKQQFRGVESAAIDCDVSRDRGRGQRTRDRKYPVQRDGSKLVVQHLELCGADFEPEVAKSQLTGSRRAGQFERIAPAVLEVEPLDVDRLWHEG